VKTPANSENSKNSVSKNGKRSSDVEEEMAGKETVKEEDNQFVEERKKLILEISNQNEIIAELKTEEANLKTQHSDLRVQLANL